MKRLASIGPKVWGKYQISRGDKIITMYSKDSQICTKKAVEYEGGQSKARVVKKYEDRHS